MNSGSRKNIHLYSVAGAYAAFKALDVDRLQGLGVKARAIIYLGLQGVSIFSPLSVRYEGTLRLRPNTSLESYSSRDVLLPGPEYTLLPTSSPSGPLQTFKKGEVPLPAIESKPSRVELVVRVDRPEDYSGLRLLVDTVLPTFFRQGYTGYNTDHTSTAWFHVGRDDPLKEGRYFVVSAEGLEASPVNLEDGTQVFTPKDVEHLMQIREMPKI